MTTSILQHDVQDFATWKQNFDLHADARAAAGAKSHTVGQLAGKPNTVVAVIEWEDMECFQAFVQNPALAEAMKAAGVMGPPTITVVTGTTSQAY